MCGRFSFAGEDIEERFDAVLSGKFEPRYNIAPGQDCLVVVVAGGREARLHRWGLVPSWAKAANIGYKMINARAETVTGKASYRKAFERRRCLVPADGFYEWIREGRVKRPVRFVLKSRETFAFAGLWELWKKPDGGDLFSFTILTTAANDVVMPVHERMPVILRRKDEAPWLDPAVTDAEKLKTLMAPYPAEEMEAYRVSPMVNSPRNDGPACIEPISEL